MSSLRFGLLAFFLLLIGQPATPAAGQETVLGKSILAGAARKHSPNFPPLPRSGKQPHQGIWMR